MLKLITLFLSVAFLSGCKIGVIVVEGGEVQTGSSGTCAITPTTPEIGAVCIHEVANSGYTETFTAVPDPGWEFVRWQSRWDQNGNKDYAYLDWVCADPANSICTISNTPLAGNPYIEAIVASNAMYYLQPIFKEIPPQPIPVVVEVDGREWADPSTIPQSALHLCPAGICSGVADLGANEYFLDGWIVAGIEEVRSLFEHYYPGSLDNFIPGDQMYVMGNDGFIIYEGDLQSGTEYYTARFISGYIGDSDIVEEVAYWPHLWNVTWISPADAPPNSVPLGKGLDTTGVWLYRPVSP